MARGKVQNWNGQTGFLVDEADGQRVFFGDRALRSLTPFEVQVGMVMEFDRGQGPKGPRADNVRRSGNTAPQPSGTGSAAPGRPPVSSAGDIPEPPAEIILPRSTQAVIRQVPLPERHTGLQLDRLSIPGDQERQRDALIDVTRVVGDRTLFAEVSRRRQECLRATGVDPWTRTTAGPLTLHLARANALENAGLCLHPVYGFAYLPGSGLKGMARAYAETIAQAPAAEVEVVFGNKPGEPVKERQKAGAIVFHDAWPTAWPRLTVDIVNNHHPKYYQGEEDAPPGDWESPNPVYFLALPAGTAFEFAIAKRRNDVDNDLLKKAREWLDGALTQLGAGAKTAAGYGSFLPTALAPDPAALASFTATLELATPAFLAGAGRQKEDCDLRSATVRGLLRWWWRAIHSGYVDDATLRRLEAAVWGDTSSGGAIRVELRPLGKIEPLVYDRQAEANKHKLPRTPNNRTTQGLWYHSFGMHDGGKQRHYMPAGTKWQLLLRVRDGFFTLMDKDGKPIPASARRIDKAILLDQARAALWWLCRVGGVGSKARKSFGSFCEPPELEAFQGGMFVDLGQNLRDACGLLKGEFKPARAGGPTIRQMVNLGRTVQPNGSGWVELNIPTTNVWQALDATGMAAQMFAKSYKHRREKCALGLPRRIGHPANGQFRPGQGVKDRHSSPTHYHLHPEGDGYVLRVAAFPAVRLPNLADSEAMLRELLQHLAASFP